MIPMLYLNWIKTSILILTGFLCIGADNNQNPIDTKALEEWRAGEIVEEKAVLAYGIEKCFASSPIPDKVWQRMQGKTYKDNPNIGRNDLRHIRTLHWDYDNRIHIGEMICNKMIADRIVEIFRQLYEAKYPHPSRLHYLATPSALGPYEDLLYLAPTLPRSHKTL